MPAAATERRRVAKPLGRGPAPRLGAPGCAALRQLGRPTTLRPWLNMARLAAQTAVSVRRPVLCVIRKRLGLPRKTKKDPSGARAEARRCRAERAAPCSLPGASFAERVKSIAPEDLVFVDEI